MKKFILIALLLGMANSSLGYTDEYDPLGIERAREYVYSINDQRADYSRECVLQGIAFSNYYATQDANTHNNRPYRDQYRKYSSIKEDDY